MRIITGTIVSGITIGATDGPVLIGGNVTNNGTQNPAVYAGPGITCDIRNLGVVGNTSGTFFGALLNGPATITNGSPTATDTLIAGTAFGVDAYSALAVTNYGTIESSSSGISGHSGGTVVNGSATDPGALISGGDSEGVVFGAPATITNFGTISSNINGLNLEGGGQVTNGSASQTHSSITGSNGIVLQGGGATTVSNFGVILATDLYGGGAGVYALSGVAPLKVTNAASASISGRYGIHSAVSGSITNLGTISGLNIGGANGEAIELAGGTITNGAAGASTALLQGHFAGAYLTDTGRIVNLGRIVGGGVGALFAAGGSVVNGNAADTTAVIGNGLDGIDFSGSAAGTVTNFGTISGSISALSFGDGSDVLSVQAGAVFVGAVTGGGGSDIVTFAVAGSHPIGNFAGFERYRLSSGGANKLTLTNANFAGVSGSVISVFAGSAGDTVSAATVVGVGTLDFTGGNGADVVTGGAGADTLTGGGGADTLNGGLGADTMTGGLGDDVYFVDDPGDRVVEASNAGVDRVVSSITYSLTLGVENLTLSGGASINGVGNGLANTLVGNAAANVLRGGASGDTLTGGGGRDRFTYVAVADTAPGAGNFDRITDFTAGFGSDADIIDLSHISGATTIQGLITPASPSETPPAAGLHAHSIAWYQAGTETVVIVNASATANHVDMEIALKGVAASSLSTTSGVNFISSPSAPAAARAALFTQAVAGGFGMEASASQIPAIHSALATDHPLPLAARTL